LDRMNEMLRHRGPDEANVKVFPRAGLAASRLSIIDLTGGRQPLSNEAETRWIVYNGEIYNFLDLRKELETLGHRFRTRSDTEVVLHAYEEWGENCVLHLRGMFAFVIYDRNTGIRSPNRETHKDGDYFFIARDRAGKKPLYYYQDANYLVFGSEIKSILAHPSVVCRTNSCMLPFYLTYGYIPGPFTMFANIYELLPGHTLTVRGGRVSIHPYWNVPHSGMAEQEPISENECAERLRELLKGAIRARLISDVPLGAFLSGGLDSTAIVACMARLQGKPVKTFAIGFADDPSYDELEYARVAARTYGCDHHELIVGPEAIQLLPKIVWHYDQPFADSSAIPTYLVSRLAREHVTVVLTGDGSDELFAGYERFAAARLAEAYHCVPQLLQVAVAQVLGLLPESTTYNGFVRRARRFVQSASLPLIERYLGWVGIFQPAFIRELLTRTVDLDPVGHFHAYFDQHQNGDAIGQLLSVDMKTYLPGDLLVKTDRMTMANSLEARCPFLDQQLVEFAAKIPSELKLRGMTSKYILKRAVEGLVPREIIRRKKHGFGVPVGHWFRTSLKRYLHETVLSPVVLNRGYFNESTLRRLIDEHQSGKRDHSHRLWALLTFEIWHQIFIDQEISPCVAETWKEKLKSCASLVV
jgi:asparagine synthase (glutamine-hydrolysing)